jgi:mRNA-degrading endonuclease toxin of MazEF toxin-antitoxin module
LRDCGKADAAVVIQSDRLKATDSVLVLLTSAPADTSLCRLQIEPSAANLLKAPSQAMVDKIAPCQARNTAGDWQN